MTDYAKTLQQVHAQIASAAKPEQLVQLVAVSKTHPTSSIIQLAEQGQLEFGENYLQEARAKQRILAEQYPDLPLIWHFIGHIQRNKTHELSQHFDWVHGVDRPLIAQRLSDQRPDSKSPLNVCLQVNIDRQASKDGCDPDETLALVAAIGALPRLRLRGLMVIPNPEQDAQAAFAQTQALFEHAHATHPNPSDWDTLSMGMSGDFKEAIAHGSTLVRVGTALFGQRPTV